MNPVLLRHPLHPALYIREEVGGLRAEAAGLREEESLSLLAEDLAIRWVGQASAGRREQQSRPSIRLLVLHQHLKSASGRWLVL